MGIRKNKIKHDKTGWEISSFVFSLVSLILGILTLILLCRNLEIQSYQTFIDLFDGGKRFVGGYEFHKPNSSERDANYFLDLNDDKTVELWIPHSYDKPEMIKGNWELQLFGENCVIITLSKPAILVLGSTYYGNAFRLYIKDGLIYGTRDAMQAVDYTQATKMKKVY